MGLDLTLHHPPTLQKKPGKIFIAGLGEIPAPPGNAAHVLHNNDLLNNN